MSAVAISRRAAGAEQRATNDLLVILKTLYRITSYLLLTSSSRETVVAKP